MITKITEKNKLDYLALFQKVTNDLKNRDYNGKVIDENNLGTPALEYEPIKLSKSGFENYISNILYQKDDTNGEYKEITDVIKQTILTNWDNEEETKTFYCAGSITSLQEFFANLVAIGNANLNYIRLPLDEEPIEINLQTRTLKVPNIFTTQGIPAVVNDEMAETIFFQVDRYFDHMDLLGSQEKNTDGFRLHPVDILIEWENAAGEKGVSRPTILDGESVEGKIIFGWILDNMITKAPGPVTFAVRFYAYTPGGEHGLSYNLSTLSSKIIIADSLNYNISEIFTDNSEYQMSDRRQDLLQRLTNSISSSTSNVQVEPPEFVNGLEVVANNDLTVKFLVHDEDGHLVTNFKAQKTFEEDGTPVRPGKVGIDINLLTDDEGIPSQPLWVAVQAKNKEGSLDYEWHKTDFKNQSDADTLKTRTVYYPSTSASLQEGTIYYYYKDEDDASIVKYLPAGVTVKRVPDPESTSIMVLAFQENGDGPQHLIRERYSEALFNSVGRYAVTATSRIHSVGASTRSPENLKDEVGTVTAVGYCRVLEPEAPQFSVTAEFNYKQSALFTLKDNLYSISLTASDAASKKEVNGHTYLTSDGGMITYKWEYKPFTANAEWETLTQFTGKKCEVSFDEASTGEISTDEGVTKVYSGQPIIDENTSLPQGDGYYRVTLVNNLNRGSLKSTTGNICTKNSEKSIEWRVTHKASPVILTYATQEGHEDDIVENTTDNTLSILRHNLPNGNLSINTPQPVLAESRTSSDTFTYQWYKYVALDMKDIQDDFNKSAAGVYRTDSQDIAIPNATTEVLSGESIKAYPDAYFYCQVTNHYNGDTSITCSRFISITDVESNVASNE